MSVIFTNGCFDILHRGHVEMLNYCKSLGRVVVGLNSDNSVKRLKGKNRPINSQDDRKYILESLTCVDKVIVFDEDTPISLLKLINPDIIVKGGDYEEKEVIGQNLFKVIIFDYVEGYSTTSTIQHISNW
jgi:D-beta-D-heptose 7-phosphate kinase/D-beta-D-heptose 1-phosphate adenosyltransferase